MLDNLNAHNGRSDAGRDRAHTVPEQASRVSDREVPLGLSRTPASVHAWLDGAISVADVRGGDTVRHVEFWNAVNAEAERRRQVTTPTHLQAQIMAALPKSAPAPATSWWERPIELNPVIAVAAAAGLLALGAAFGARAR